MRPHRSLRNRINEFVNNIFQGYKPTKVRDSKAIHESLWGTNIYRKHEIAVLDCPLLQRLRQISQTGLAFLIYPSATHSRFEHTLGVITLIDRFVDSINQSVRSENMIKKDSDKGEYAELRMAALLHDCGHSFLSHISEMVYEWDHEIRAILKSDEFAHTKPHEVFSYYIVKSPSFKKFFKKYVSDPYPIEINLENVANMIIGRVTDNKRAFLTRIINGPFDADKLDYISRDGYFSGLRLTIDLDRLFYTLSTHEFREGLMELTVKSPVPLEHILFSKLLLYTSIYHHKVKACDCMIQGLLEYIQENDVSLMGATLRDPVNFLRFTDNDLFNNIHSKDPFIKKMVKNLLDRKLFKRAAVISRDTIENYDECIPELLERINQSPEELYELRQKIVSKMPRHKKCSIHEVWVSMPEAPSLREAAQTYVTGGTEPIILNDLFPVDGWLKAYADKQLKGHVFAPPEFQEEVCKAVERAFKDLDIKINREKNRFYCRMS
ncbi:MAG: HD domain-containing protein [Nitrospirota bacterium]